MIGTCPWCGGLDWQRRDDYAICTDCYLSFTHPDAIENLDQ